VARVAKPAGDFLEPITSKVKRKKFLVFDIESKHGCDFDVAKGHGCPICEDEGPDRYVDSRGEMRVVGVGQKPGFTRPFLVGLYDPERGRYQEFRDEPHLAKRRWDRRHLDPGGCVDKLMSVVLSKRYSGYAIYSHNGGDFDMLFLLAWLREHRDEFDFEIVPVQTTIQVLHVWRRVEGDKPVREKWEFLDSIKLLPMSLQKACTAFGVEGKLDHDLGMHEDDPRWSDYLKQDNIALSDVLRRFYDLVEDLGGEVGITTPSTSMKLFRRRFMGKDDVQERIPRYKHWEGCEEKATCAGCMHDWIRRGYYGGRTEIHRFEGEGLKYFDLNSSYVAAMARLMPVGDRVVEEGRLDWRRHESQGGTYTGFCECTVWIPPSCEIPPLPHRSRETGKLIFPAGRFHGVWSVEELALLEDPLVGGRIEYVRKTAWFGLRPMFRRMVEELWGFRDKTRPDYDEGLSLLAKLLGNGGYGKFAMKPDRSSVVFAKDVERGRCFLCGEETSSLPDRGPETGDRGPRPQPRAICLDCEGSKPAASDPDTDVWYQAKRTDAGYIIPQVAAHITALARMRLWDYMAEVVRQCGQIFYCDTDSIVCNVELPSSPELGRMKDEYPGERLRFSAVQPKVYLIERTSANDEIAAHRASLLGVGDVTGADKLKAHKSKVTMKGFPPRLRTAENLDRLKRGDKLSIDRLEKVRTLARLGFKRSPRMVRVDKGFRSTYDKRIVVGNETRPIVLDEPVGGYDEAIDQAAE